MAHHGQICHSETEIAASTPTNQFIVHGDGTVSDKKTGLMWKQCSEGQSGSACSTGSATNYEWDEALFAAQSSSTANYDDWRLPTYKELYSLVEHRCYHPAINLSVFPAGHRADPQFYELDYWSSTIDDDYFIKAVDFTNGSLKAINQSSYGNVRLVRSGFIPQSLVAYQAFRNEFMPLARHQKCINCHEMTTKNATWQTHIDQGRITTATDVAHDEEVCAACHTSGSGFANRWRAPGSFFTVKTLLMSSTTAEDACSSLNRLRDPYHHLTEDELILWAVEQIKGLTLESWLNIVEKMRTPNTNKFTCAPPAQ
ncbi:hypothetical protein NBRC116583_25990 [Arenicella sp. 4NH20-0111]